MVQILNLHLWSVIDSYSEFAEIFWQRLEDAKLKILKKLNY